MPVLSETSKQRLATCDIRLQDVLNEAIKHMDFVVIEGHRDEAAQNEAVRTGKSQKPWPTGNHNRSPSSAVDIAPYFADIKNVDWGDIVAFGRLMGVVQCIADQRSIALRFGLDWNSNLHTVGRDPKEHLLDAPHIELVNP
jgi:peptidoglycan L-alanyl-D-glutamate endopeptidase CwlK